MKTVLDITLDSFYRWKTMEKWGGKIHTQPRKYIIVSQFTSVHMKMVLDVKLLTSSFYRGKTKGNMG